MSAQRWKSVVVLVGASQPLFCVESYEWIRKRVEAARDSVTLLPMVEVTAVMDDEHEVCLASFDPLKVVVFLEAAREKDEA